MDADEKPPTPEKAYTLRQRERGFALIKIWVPEELTEQFRKNAADARAMKRALTA